MAPLFVAFISSLVAGVNAGPAATAAPAVLDVAALQRACDGGDGDACGKLAAGFATGRGVPHKNVARARILYDAGCADGDAAACGQAGLARETGALSTRLDPEAAHDEYVKGCDGGDRDSCMRAASYEAIAKLPESRAHFQKACALGDVHGCIGYASLIRRSAPLEAAREYRKGCDAQIDAACFALARLCGQRQWDACQDLKAPPPTSDDGRAHGHTKTDAFSFAIPAGTRLVDVVRDARLRRRIPVLVDVDGEGAVELVPVRDDVDFPTAIVGELSVAAPIAATDEAACRKIDLGFYAKLATVFSARTLDSPYGRGCEFRMLARGRTRHELHLFMAGLDDSRAFQIVVLGENEPAEAVLQGVLSSLKRGG